VNIAAGLARLGSNFRLIDFGSSLGYFPFFFADRGAVTTGLDVNPRNTAVALATQQLNGLPAEFATAALSLETVAGIPHGKHDVALILSVLHHITHQHGMQYVTRLIADLLDRIPTLVLELAVREENVNFAWRDSLPEDPLAILDRCGKVQVSMLGRSRSHLSDSQRPLYLISREGTALRDQAHKTCAAKREEREASREEEVENCRCC
jgi:O-antigen chain-terminating methyltransferase